MIRPTQSLLYPTEAEQAAFLLDVRQQTPRQLRINCSGEMPVERLAQAVRLPEAPRAVDDAAWSDVPTFGPFLRQHQQGCEWAAGYDVRAAFDDHALAVRVRTPGRCIRRGFAVRWHTADSIQLMLDPAHEHLHYLHLAIVPDGRVVAFQCRRPFDSQRWERKLDEHPLDVATICGDSRPKDESWSAVLRVPFDLIEARPGRRWGFNCYHQRSDPLASPVCWNLTHHHPMAPWGAGQLAFGVEPALHLSGVDLGDMRLGPQSCRLHLRAVGGRSVRGHVRLQVVNEIDGKSLFWSGEQKFTLTEAQTDGVILEMAMRWNPRDHRHHRLIIDVTDEQGRSVRAVYRLGRGEGRLMQLAPPASRPCPDPEPGTPDFIDRKRDFILSHLPVMQRLTTAQGAASDFVLAGESGQPVFNLMRTDALQQIAAYLYDLFDNDIDRLLGSTLFVNQPAVFTYANAPSPLVSQLSPLSLLRFGSGQCCCFAAVQIGILEQMRCDLTGRLYRATRVGVPGHVITAVEFGNNLVALDPSLGRFYYLPGDRELASMAQILADPSITARAGNHLEHFYAKGAAKPDTPFYYPPGQTIWPPGAPDERLSDLS